MLEELSFCHVGCGDGYFSGKLIPKLEILVKFSPTLGDSGGNETEEVIQEFKNELIIFITVLLNESQLLILDIVGEGIGQEIGDIGPHLYL
jgi:hypothetical protein